MSTVILDTASYGNARFRDLLSRNLYQSVKGSGVAPAEVSQGFYRIESSSSTSQQLVQLKAKEAAINNGIATLGVNVYDGTSLNEVLTLNNTLSKVTAAEFNINIDGTYYTQFLKNGTAVEQRFNNAGTDVVLSASSDFLTVTAADTKLSGKLHVGSGQILKDDLVEGCKVLLTDHATDPVMDFYLGNLGASPIDVLHLSKTQVTSSQKLNMSGQEILNIPTLVNSSLALGAQINLISSATAPEVSFQVGNLAGSSITPLMLDSTSVNVTGVLNVNGQDVMSLIAGENPWSITGSTVYLENAYDLIQINMANSKAYTTSVALDVNGSIVARGDSIYMWDSTGNANLSALYFDSANNDLFIRTSLATQGANKDNLIFETTSGANNTYLERFNIAGGAGVQKATFSNVDVGIGAAASGTYKLEVTGKGYFSDTLSVAGTKLDMLNNKIENALSVTSTDTLADRAKIAMTSDAAAASMTFSLGNLAATPTDALVLSAALVTVQPATIFNNDITVKGNDVNFWDVSANQALSQMNYSDGTAMNLRSLIVGEPLQLQTAGASDLTPVTRLILGSGAASSTYFTTDTRLGVGATPSGSYRLEVTGTSNFTGDASFQANVDMTSGDINAITNLVNNTLAEGAKINLVTHATDPEFDFYLGNLSGTPIDALKLTKTMATFNTAVEFQGDLDMHAYNIKNVSNVYNSSAALSAEVQFLSHATDPLLNFKLGNLAGVPVTALALSQTQIVGNVDAILHEDLTVDKTLLVTQTSTLVGDVTATILKYDQTGTSAGGSAIQIGAGTGVQFRALATAGTLLSTTPQFIISETKIDTEVDLYMSYKDVFEVSDFISNIANTGGSKLTFVNGAAPKLDFYAGNLESSPSAVLELTPTAINMNRAVNMTAGDLTITDNMTVQGNLYVAGSTVTLNTATVSVEDINIELASNATAHPMLNGGGITLGPNIADGNVAPAITYNTSTLAWDTNVDLNVASGKTISINETDAILSASGLTFGSSAAAMFLGGTLWKMVHYFDGAKDNLLFQHYDGSAYVTKFAIEA
jgi:hypothetical protein